MTFPVSMRLTLGAAALLAALPLAATAQIKVGVTVSSTGPAASLGIPERDTVALLPTEIGGQTVQYIVLDDATDTTQAVKNIRKLTADDHVDVVLGTSVTPGSLAMSDVAAEAKGIKIVAAERFARPDTSVTGQVLKLLSAKPDGILIGASGTPVALPQRELVERGYKGRIYQTHGAANNDVLRVCGKACEGMILPAGPLLVADQLPDSNPAKASALVYVKAYEAKYGAGTTNTFGGHMWDAGQLINDAIPRALKTGAKPGTPEFRAALRDALEQVKELPASQGVFTMSPTDHAGLDERGRVMVQVVNGTWTYQPDL